MSQPSAMRVPGISAVNEFEKFLEVLRNSHNDGLGGGDGASRVVFRLHHAFYKTQPVKLHTEGQGNTYSYGNCEVKHAIFCLLLFLPFLSLSFQSQNNSSARDRTGLKLMTAFVILDTTSSLERSQLIFLFTLAKLAVW